MCNFWHSFRGSEEQIRDAGIFYINNHPNYANKIGLFLEQQMEFDDLISHTAISAS